MSSASAIYRVRVATAGSTVVTGNVAVTLTEADLVSAPIIRGPSVDILEAKTTSHPFAIDVINDSALFATTAGRWTTIGRLIDVQRALDGSTTYTTMATGRIGAVREEDGPGKITLEVTDERWVERRGRMFAGTTTCQLHPPGLSGAFMEVAAAGTAEYYVAETTTNAVKLSTVPDESDEGTALDVDARVPISMMRALARDVKRNQIVSSTNAAGNFNSLRFEYSAGDHEVIAFREDLDSTIPGEISKWGVLGTLSPYDGGGILAWAWVHIPSHGLSAGNTITGRFHFPSPGVEPDAQVPFHIGGAAGIHPMTLLKNALNGDYGGSAVQYSTGAVSTLESISMRPVWVRATETVERSAWLRENVYKPYGVVPSADVDLSLTPISLRQVQNENPATYTVLSSTNARVPTWQHVSQDMVNVLEFKSRRIVRTNREAQAPADWPVDFLEPVQARAEWTHDNTATFGEIVRTVDTELVMESANGLNTNDASHELAIELFDVFGDAPTRGYITVADDANVNVGDQVLLDQDSLKAYNPNTDARTGDRVVQLVSFTEHGPASITFEYLDKGPNSQALAAPTVAITESTANKDYVNVAISSLPTGAKAVVEASWGTTTSFDHVRSDVGNETVSFYLAGSSGTAYTRARSTAPGRISSAWATDSVALSARARITSAEIDRTGTVADTTWDVPGGTAGMLTDYDLHYRSVAPTWGSNIAHYSTTGSGFTVTGVGPRQVVSVKLTPYTGWGGSTVSGTAGDTIVLEALRPRVTPGLRPGFIAEDEFLGESPIFMNNLTVRYGGSTSGDRRKHFFTSLGGANGALHRMYGSTGGLEADIYVDSVEDLVLSAVNNDIRLAPSTSGGRVNFDTITPTTSENALNEYLHIQVNGTDRSIRLYTVNST